MKAILDFIVHYWEILSSLVLLLVSIILLIIKKKPINSIFQEIFDLCLIAVRDTEVYSMADPNVKGSDKLNNAIGQVLRALQFKYPKLNVSKYISNIELAIENILSTPQKKEREVSK